MRIDGIDELQDGRKIVLFTLGEGPAMGAGYEFWPQHPFPPEGESDFHYALLDYLNGQKPASRVRVIIEGKIVDIEDEALAQAVDAAIKAGK